jgi:hypothetical protein
MAWDDDFPFGESLHLRGGYFSFFAFHVLTLPREGDEWLSHRTLLSRPARRLADRNFAPSCASRCAWEESQRVSRKKLAPAKSGPLDKPPL